MPTDEAAFELPETLIEDVLAACPTPGPWSVVVQENRWLLTQDERNIALIPSSFEAPWCDPEQRDNALVISHAWWLHAEVKRLRARLAELGA